MYRKNTILIISIILLGFSCRQEQNEDEKKDENTPVENVVDQPLIPLVVKNDATIITKPKEPVTYYDQLFDVTCLKNDDRKSCQTTYQLETENFDDPNILIKYTVPASVIDGNHSEISFDVPRLIATCARRCPNHFDLNFEIIVSDGNNTRVMIPSELETKTIKASKDCTERYGYSARTDVDIIKPPCVYEFLPYTRNLSIPLTEKEQNLSYQLRISHHSRYRRKTTLPTIKVIIEDPIVFEWR